VINLHVRSTQNCTTSIDRDLNEAKFLKNESILKHLRKSRKNIQIELSNTEQKMSFMPPSNPITPGIIQQLDFRSKALRENSRTKLEDRIDLFSPQKDGREGTMKIN